MNWIKMCVTKPVFRLLEYFLQGEQGKVLHLQKSICDENQGQSPECDCVIKEVWLAPPPETPSPHYCPYVSKVILANAIGLKLTGEVLLGNGAFINEAVYVTELI